ncbi:MAG: ABC transporter ATP-binding protein [Gammaproteobacteria bacterium]|nr:ABC transporter ATP-binding protein [Gammaproteobacteria bacterium]
MKPIYVSVSQLSKVYYKTFSSTQSSIPPEKTSLSKEDKLILNDINFELRAGEIVGIIGRNGAGKSTLLSILAGITEPTYGNISLNGKVTAVLTLGVGLREDMSGRENIYLDGEIQGKSKNEIDSMMDKMIEFSELGDFIDKPVKTYSSGMKSRLAISMLTEIQPEILIIDEALSAGDAFFAQKASKKIKEICQRGKIVIIVSHSMETIKLLCSRCIWLEEGRIYQDGLPSEVTQLYLKKIYDERKNQTFHPEQHTFTLLKTDANYELKMIKLSMLDHDEPQSLFNSGDNFLVEVQLKQRIFSLTPISIEINLERLDGLLVTSDKFIVQNNNSVDNLHCRFALSKLILNQGYYKLNLKIWQEQELCSFGDRYFEVKNSYISAGGKALLHYPVKAQLKTKDTEICLDLAELTIK